MDIEVFSGATRCGYITTVQPGARMTTPLDKIGSFSFECSASDPSAGSLVNGRTVYGYEMGKLKLSGIIGTISQSVDGGGVPTLRVSGDAIARELVQARTGVVTLAEQGKATAVGVSVVHIDPGTGAGSGAYLLSESFDGNPATPVTGADFTDNDKWLYIGGAVPFAEMYFTCAILAGGYGGGTWGDGNPMGPSFQYFDGTDWVAAAMTADTTRVSGDSFAQDGYMTFTLSGGPMRQTTEHGVSAYFVRGRFNAAADRIALYEVQTKGLVPTDTALALVAATFPTVANGYAGTWTLDTVTGLSATVKTDVYDTIYRGNAFEALTKLAELTGEHFYCTADRKVVWIGNTLASSGVRIYSPSAPALVEADATVALLTSLKVTKDSHKRVTRVYPRGAGLGDGSLTLTYTTKTAPAGYVLDAAAGFIRIDPEGTRIDAEEDFKDIGPVTADRRARENAADALFDAALVWLGRHSATLETYDIECVNLASGAVKPGNTVWVEYKEWVAGQQVISVDDDALIVLAITETLGEGAAVVSALTVSTVAEWPVKDDEFLSRMYRNQRATGSTPQSVGVADVRTSDFAVNGMALTTGGGGLAYGGSSAASGSTVGGGMAAHELVGGYHTATGLTFGPPAQVLKASTASTFVWDTIDMVDLPIGDGTPPTSLAPGTTAANSGDDAYVARRDHVHGLTTSAVGAASTIMATDANGGYTFGASGSMGWSDVALSRGAANRLDLSADDEFRHADYAIDSDGMRLTGEGAGYFRYLYAAEFHAKSFIADLEQALAGGQWIGKSVAPLAAAFDVPGASGYGEFVVQCFQGFDGFKVFSDGDLVRLRVFDRSGASLTIEDAWGTVKWLSTDTMAKTQTWAFARSALAVAGSESTSPGNWITNHGFETNLTGWINTGTNAPTSAREAAVSAIGTACAAVSFAGANSMFATDQIANKSNFSGHVLTFTAWVNTAAANVRLVYQADFASTTEAYSAYHRGDGTWQRLTLTVTPSFDQGGSTSYIVFGIQGGTAATVGYLDGCYLVSDATYTTLPKGALVLDYGVSGNGYIESVAQSGAMGSGVPYITMKTWTTHPQTTLTERVHLGHMNGAYGITTDVFGMGIGDYTNGDYLRYDTTNGLVIQVGGGKFRWDATGESIYESGETNLFKWFDPSARQVAADFILESDPGSVTHRHYIYAASYYGAAQQEWALFGGTVGTPGTALATMGFYGASGGSSLILGFNGTANVCVMDSGGYNTSAHYEVGGNQVVGARGAHVADATTDTTSLRDTVNAILSRLEAHGLLATA